MLTKNKLDKSFGPVGTSAGSLLFIAGLIVILNSLYGLILILLGAFVGFSSTSAIIDTEKKRMKFSNNVFGIIQTGKWIQIDKTMKIGLKESNKTWTSYSRGNRSLDIEDKDYRISIFDVNKNEIMEINKNDSIDSAKVKLEELANQLGIGLI